MMTREALAHDRGLQPERTDLAWTRTSLAVVVAGGMLMFKDRDVAGLTDHPERVLVGCAAVVVTCVVSLIGGRRRRRLRLRPRTARREVLSAGTAVLVLSALVVAYLALPLL